MALYSKFTTIYNESVNCKVYIPEPCAGGIMANRIERAAMAVREYEGAIAAVEARCAATLKQVSLEKSEGDNEEEEGEEEEV